VNVPKAGLQLIFDLDGVIYHGDRVNPGAVELLAWLQQQAIPYHFHTNAGQRTREEIQHKLAAMNIYCDPGDITTASETVTAYVVADYPDIEYVHTLGGGNGLRQELELCGITPLPLEKQQEKTAPCPLVIGLTEDFNYDMMSKILLMEEHISDIYATDNDARFTANGQLFPGTGWQNAAIEYVMNKKIKSSGKPARQALDYVLSEKINSSVENVIIIGDNIYSDIAGGNAIDCQTILIMGGTTKAVQLENLESEIYRPSHIAADMVQCREILTKLIPAYQ